MKYLVDRIIMSGKFIKFNLDKTKIIVYKDAKIYSKSEVIQEYAIQDFINEYANYVLLNKRSYIYYINKQEMERILQSSDTQYSLCEFSQKFWRKEKVSKFYYFFECLKFV